MKKVIVSLMAAVLFAIGCGGEEPNPYDLFTFEGKWQSEYRTIYGNPLDIYIICNKYVSGGCEDVTSWSEDEDGQRFAGHIISGYNNTNQTIRQYCLPPPELDERYYVEAKARYRTKEGDSSVGYWRWRDCNGIRHTKYTSVKKELPPDLEDKRWD